MLQGMTVSVALFFLLVLVPGYICAWGAARLEEARRLPAETIYRGSMIFGLCLLLLEKIPCFSEKYGKYGKTLIGALSGNIELVTAENLGVWVLTFWGSALGLGLAQLLFDLRSVRAVRASNAWRKLIGGSQPLETSARSDILWEIFLCYRVLRRCPLVRISVKGADEPLVGEVLKASRGERGGVVVGPC